MSLRHRIATLACGSLAALALPGCAALNQLAALRAVTFAFAGVSDVRVAGVRVLEGATYRSLSVQEAARIGAAVATRSVPLEMIAHLSAFNPQSNGVTARMVALDWTMFVEDHRTLSGGLDHAVAIGPGQLADVPLAVRLDLLQLGSGGARDLFELALAIAGHGTIRKDLRFDLVPTIDTAVGPIRYPSPIVVRRSAD